MKSYLNIIQNVLENGVWKKNRTGTKALSINCHLFQHDMTLGFPLLTTRKMPYRSMAVELEGFIKGINSKKWYQDRGCRFWDQWANPYALKMKFGADYLEKMSREEILKAQLEEDDLGANYGVQWRRFNEAQDEDDTGWVNILEAGWDRADQLQTLINNLKKDPFDRRLIVSAWNPLQLDRTALPSCHCFFQIVYNGVDKLDLNMYQRSCDLMLGVPNNIAQYGLLLLLICKETNYKPGFLNILFADTHIYENHLNKAEKQLTRQIKPLPKLVFKRWTDIFNWSHKDISLEGYNPHSKIDFGAVAV